MGMVTRPNSVHDARTSPHFISALFRRPTPPPNNPNFRPKPLNSIKILPNKMPLVHLPNGKSLHYRLEWINHESHLAPMVFIHGLGSSQNYYGAVCESLKKSSLHIRFDIPGSGRSPVPPAPQTLESLSDDVISLLDLLTLETVLLVGHSLGGLIACNVAATHPSRVKKLILIGPVYPTPNTQKIFEDRINTLKQGTYLPIQNRINDD
jgi:pimeloyl-ACP methyl ester carboxylesterase